MKLWFKSKKRPPKKTASLEIRLTPEEKSEFLKACRAAGTNTSEFMRIEMRRMVRRTNERPVRQKMMLTMALIAPLALTVSADTNPVAEPNELERCTGQFDTKPPIFPADENGEPLPVPDGGAEVTLQMDITEHGTPYNIEFVGTNNAAEPFIRAAINAVNASCIGPGARDDEEVKFDFRSED
jgi:hypothetical protein